MRGRPTVLRGGPNANPNTNASPIHDPNPIPNRRRSLCSLRKQSTPIQMDCIIIIRRNPVIHISKNPNYNS